MTENAAPAPGSTTITNVADFRPGDPIKGEFETQGGRWVRFEGDAYDDDCGALYVANTLIRFEDGGSPPTLRNLTTSRPVPSPPQELGAVILDVTTVCGLAFARMMRVDAMGEVYWRGARGPRFPDADLVSWTTVTITPNEQVTR